MYVTGVAARAIAAIEMIQAAKTSLDIDIFVFFNLLLNI